MNLMTRSQAKRLLSHAETFNEVIFDFNTIQSIGHSFADEIFRMYNNSHPEVKISYVNANAEVELTIKQILETGNGNKPE